MSSGLMNRLKWKNLIFVNGTAQHTDYPIQPGDIITVPLDEPVPEYPAQEGPLTVLYEDEYLLAVDKPAGLLVHPSRTRLTGTLANYVLGYYQKTRQKSAFHPLTRLDRDTFGLVLLAKNAHIHALLGANPPQKTYEALVCSAPPEDSGTWSWPIGRLPLPSLLRRVDPAGKVCITQYRVLERTEDTARLWLRPVTGRTHQLRVHCAHAGCPILGDPQYGNEASMILSQKLGYNYQQLCAKTLEFTHPITGKALTISSRF